MAHLERQRAGMGGLVETARRRPPGIHDHQAPGGLQPIKAGIGGLRGRAPLGLRPGQDEVDQHPVLFERIVEQR